MPILKIKRIYQCAGQEDGYRILVDKLWPRGVKKEDAHIDLWLKGVAPSTELRQWFNHEPKKWSEFYRNYHAELKDKGDFLEVITRQLLKTDVTLLYAAKDETFNHANALRDYIQKS